MRRRTPLRVVSPCVQDWGTLPRTAEGYFCPSCRKHVHDLSAMTRRQADAYRAQFDAPICVLVRKGADGEPAFAPERVPRAGAGPVAVLAAALTACSGPSDVPAPARATPSAVVAPQPPAPVAAPPTAAPLPPPPPDPTAAPNGVVPTVTEEAALHAAHQRHHFHHQGVNVGGEVLGGLEASDDL